MSEMLKEVAAHKAEMQGIARGEEPDLPQGSAPVEAAPGVEPVNMEVDSEVPEVAPNVDESPAVAPAESEKPIRIGSQTFKTQAEAMEYAEKLEQDKLYQEAYSQGVRETLQAQPSSAIAAPPPEDNFDEEFYSNPKATILKVKEQAKEEALRVIRGENQKEALWKTFEERYPDVERKDAEIILSQNMDTVGKMTDIDKAMEVLARKTRAEYQRIVEKFKPRTELPPSRGQAVVPSSSTPRSVTPAKKEEPVLTMAQQMKNLREQKRNSPA